MEPPEPIFAKFKLWRWLLLLTVITVALGGLVSWKMRTERLHFVEPIWSDSLVGQERDAAAGQRRKIGEVWSLSRYRGFSLFGRGVSSDFEGRYPIFTESDAPHEKLAKQLLAEVRAEEEFFSGFHRFKWWDSIKIRGDIRRRRSAIQVLFYTDYAVSLRESTSEFFESGPWESLSGHTLVNRDGEWQTLHRDELFDGKDWVEVVSKFCVADLKRQGIEDRAWTSFDYHNLATLSLTPAGVTFYPPSANETREVLIPFEILVDHLKPDGPHRLFQRKSASER